MSEYLALLQDCREQKARADAAEAALTALRAEVRSLGEEATAKWMNRDRSLTPRERSTWMYREAAFFEVLDLIDRLGP